MKNIFAILSIITLFTSSILIIVGLFVQNDWLIRLAGVVNIITVIITVFSISKMRKLK